jgi:hypothetical protein
MSPGECHAQESQMGCAGCADLCLGLAETACRLESTTAHIVVSLRRKKAKVSFVKNAQ